MSSSSSMDIVALKNLRKAAKRTRRASTSHTQVDLSILTPREAFDITRYRGIVDEAGHISGWRDVHLPARRLKARGGMQRLSKFYMYVCKNVPVASLLDGCGWFGPFCASSVNCRGDQGLLDVLVEKWWDHSHTFHFSDFELSVTPGDFTYLTGIPIGIGHPPLYGSMNYDPFPGLNTSNGRLLVSKLKEWIKEQNERLQSPWSIRQIP